MLSEAVLEGGVNYHAWSREVRRSLGSKNELCFIGEEKPSVKIPKPRDQLFDYWRQANDMVISRLHKSMNETIKPSIIWINSARDIWKDLEERYDRGDDYRLSDFLESFRV